MYFFTYILYSEKLDRYYIGSTGDDIYERLRRHNSNHKGFTGRTDDWKIVYSEKYNSKPDALTREKSLKSLKSRVKLEELIRSVNF
jgi:putative endonuclease